jgi:hypothetical protein
MHDAQAPPLASSRRSDAYRRCPILPAQRAAPSRALERRFRFIFLFIYLFDFIEYISALTTGTNGSRRAPFTAAGHLHAPRAQLGGFPALDQIFVFATTVPGLWRLALTARTERSVSKD